MRRRRRQLLLLGITLSMIAHLILYIYLAVTYRRAPGGGGPQQVQLELALLAPEPLTELEDLEFEDLLPEIEISLEELPSEAPSAELDAASPAATLEISSEGAMPTLGGAGQATGSGTLGGGTAGTSFFGISASGTRFAYIVDISGSMGQGRKLWVAMRELSGSIAGLPDYTYFYIVLFSSASIVPPMQRGWTRARPATLTHFIRWLRDVDPGGGTQPKSSFAKVFALDPVPDVIYFMTDGEISGFTADEVAQMNKQGKRTVINTIAFGDPASQDLLRDIARQSGGVYRFVPSD